jgi:hypothetical protein
MYSTRPAESSSTCQYKRNPCCTSPCQKKQFSKTLIGSVRCTQIFQGQNRTIGCILNRSARLYGDCMEPDHTAKYSLPVLTDLTENLIREKKRLCVDPLTVLRVFLDASRHSAFTHVVFVWKTRILTKLYGGKVLFYSNLGHYMFRRYMDIKIWVP